MFVYRHFTHVIKEWSKLKSFIVSNIKFHSTVSKAFLKSKNRSVPSKSSSSVKSMMSWIWRILKTIYRFCMKPRWSELIMNGNTFWRRLAKTFCNHLADDSESETETDTELQTPATPKDTPKRFQRSVSVSRSRSQSTHSEAKASQGTIIRFLGKGAPNETPNRGRPKQANTRSPVTPVDELEKKVMNGKKGKHKKYLRNCTLHVLQYLLYYDTDC